MPVVIIDLLFGVFVLATGVGLGWWLRNRGMSPLSGGSSEANQAREVLGRLHELASRVAADVGAHNSRVEAINENLSASDDQSTKAVVDAVTQLIEANSRMQQQLGSAEERLHEQAKLVESHAAAALTDALTGLPNRRAFDEQTQRLFDGYRREGRVFALVMFDVDHFKKFNDTYGHQAGDDVLKQLGALLRNQARKEDIAARYGGEEFALLLPGTGAQEAAQSAERVRAAVAGRDFRSDGRVLKVTCSFGAAAIVSGEVLASLIHRSDAALYVSKDNGRNCVHWHDGRSIHPLGARPALQPPAPEKPAPPVEKSPVEKSPVEKLAAKPSRRPAGQPDQAVDAPKPAKEAKPAREPEAEQVEGNAIPSVAPLSVSNRTEFCIILARRLAEWRRGGATPSVLMVRIDNYPQIVSDNGTRVGDLVVKATSQFLGAAIRDMDLVAQYDTCTYAVLFPGTWLTNVIRIAERLREAIAKCSLPGRQGPLRFTVSIGGAKAMETDDTKRLLERSVEALEAAEETGGNCSLFHNGAWSETISAATEREEELDHTGR